MAYLDIERPHLSTVAARLDRPAVAVPLLFAAGHHVRTDIPAALAGAPVTAAPPLGPVCGDEMRASVCCPARRRGQTTNRRGGVPVRMRMCFPPEDGESYETTKDLLIRRCQDWANAHGSTVDPFIFSAALDFRHQSVDGRLGFWTAASVREFLLDWMPRTITMMPEDAASAPEAVRTLLRYLRHTELDDPTADRLPDLEAAITDAAPDFGRAMSDERNFGLAKFWVMKALGAGIDPANGEAMERFIRRVHTGQVAYDTAALSHIAERHFHDPGTPERALPQPPVTLPSEAELADSAEKNRIVQQLRALTDWVGVRSPGRGSSSSPTLGSWSPDWTPVTSSTRSSTTGRSAPQAAPSCPS